MRSEPANPLNVTPSRVATLKAFVDGLTLDEGRYLVGLLIAGQYAGSLELEFIQRIIKNASPQTNKLFERIVLSEEFMRQLQTQIDIQLSKEVRHSVETQIKEVQTQIDENWQAMEAIEKKNMEYLGLVATETAHNINQPVGVIRALTSGTLLDLEERLIEREAYQAVLERILKQTDRLSLIIDNFRLAARGGEAKPEPTDIVQLLEHSLQLALPMIPDQIEVVIEKLSDAPPVAFVNPFQLEQVIIGLLVNSVEAVQSVKNPQINVGVRFNEQATRVFVADNGKGVVQEHIDKIFLPHFSTKSSSTNMGLGLFTSRRILRQYGADIIYKPREDGGASFWIILPNRESQDA